MKVIYCLSHPIQYFSPLLVEMAKEMNLHVLYYSDISIRGGQDKGFGKTVKWDLPLLDGHSYEFVNNWSKSQYMDCQFGDAFNPGLWQCLRKSKADIVIVNGWAYASDWLVLVYAKLLGIKVWVRAETPLNQELRKQYGLLGKVKKFILHKIIFKYFIAKFLYIGEQSKKYFQYAGAKDNQLVFTPYAVENKRFNNFYENNKNNKSEFKTALGIPSNHRVILFSGKYIEKKRPLDLVKAFAQLNNNSCTLVMMGEGNLRNEMEDYISKHKLQNIILTGFINQTEVPKYYVMADVYVMCSGMGETWGLSVNEAMNFALPILVSETCGSSYDLVQHGKNGFVFAEGDLEALTTTLHYFVTNETERLKAGKLSQSIVATYNVNTIVDHLKLALQQ